MERTVTGLAWYRRPDYDRLKSMFTDGEKLPDTYSQWLKIACRTTETLTKEGHIVEKVYIDPEAFPAWCKSKRRKLDTNARITYAAETAKARHNP